MSNTFKNNDYILNIDDIESSPRKVLEVEFDDFIDGIDSNEHIIANLEFSSLGEFIKVVGEVSGKAILECDLCLEKFEYELNFEINELYSKGIMFDDDTVSGQEIELKEGQFATDLNGSDSIDIYDLLYQSVILDFPNKKVCGINCKGGDIFIREENPSHDGLNSQPDPRMAIFKDIKLK